MTAIAVKRSFEDHKAIIRSGMRSFIEVGMSLMAIRDEELWKQTHESFKDFCRDEVDYSRSQAYRIIESAIVIRDLTLPIGNTTSRKTQILLPANESQARVLVDSAKDAKTRLTIWTTAIETAPEGKNGHPIITAAHVKKTAEAIVHKNGKPSGGGGGKRAAQTAQAPAQTPEQPAASNGHPEPPLPIPPVDPNLDAPPGERMAGDEDVDPVHCDDMKDADGHPVPKNLRETFSKRDILKGCMDELKGMAKALEGVINTPGGERLPMAELRVDLKNAREAIRAAMPHAVCPYCKGRGCKTCQTFGWVAIDQYAGIPEERRQKKK